MRILYITNGLSGSGGLERVLSVKASFLADQYAYDVHIITLNEGGKEPFYTFSSKVKLHSISLNRKSVFHYFFRYIQKMRTLARMIKPDVISVCDDGLKGFYLPYLLGKPCPMIYERHVSKNIVASSFAVGLYYKLMDIGARKYDRFVVLTEGNRNEWSGYKNIQVISNPLSFSTEQVATLKNKKVIAVGKFAYQKGYDLLIKAWKIVYEKHPDWMLEIYGANAEMTSIVCELIKSSQLQNQVCLYSPVKNIQDKYMEASIYVMSSRYEGFGMVLTEAMSCGVPCVSFDCPYGPGDIIRDGEDGFLVERENINQLADRIIKLIEDESLRLKMGSKARENVTRYEVGSVAAQWDKLFTDLVKQY